MNQHYEFWVDYYKELETNDQLSKDAVEWHNKALISHRWRQSKTLIPLQKDVLYFKVLYPGLLAGLGNAHDSQKKEEKVPEIGLGFSFDYVTGLPYIPGNTVKGILRSAFLQNPGYVSDLLKDISGRPDLSEDQIRRLELDMFGKKHPCDERPACADASRGKDVFLDAYPIRTGRESHLLGLENITPHRADDPAYDGLVAPKILNLLKVIPGVVFQFRFALTETWLGETTKVTPEQKKALFQAILTDLGAGAKTNVGFGSLEPFSLDTEEVSCYLEIVPEALLTGTVTAITNFGAFVKLDESGKSGLVHISEIAYEHVNNVSDYLLMGQRVEVVIVESRQPGKIALSIKRAKDGHQ